MSDRRIIAAFDFDVTITKRDTFVPFLYRAFGATRVRREFLKLSFEGGKVLAGLSSRDRFKERIIRSLFLGESVDRLTSLGKEHADEILTWVRQTALDRIEWHRTMGHRLVMVSASLDVYLDPVAECLGFDDLLCTRLSGSHFLYDGRILGKNCRGPEKVARLESLLGDLTDFVLYAYGDSDGDKEMLAAATHPNFRVFES